MNILIVYAHPNKNSYNNDILNSLVRNVSHKHDLKILDLYEKNFDPVLYFDDKRKRRDLQNDPSTQSYRDDIIWANHLIFIFPIWWGGMPAILKGFIDRVFVKGFAYEYKRIFPVALLPNKTATILITHDTPNLYAKFFQQDYGKVLDKQILKMCGIKTVKKITLPFIRNSSEAKRIDFLNRISTYANRI